MSGFQHKGGMDTNLECTGSATSLRVAYADPPYIGQARKHYSHDPRCAEVDHAKLIEHLNTFDAWALSCSSPSLRQILPLCPADVRVMAWVKFCTFKVNVNPAYAWEPVIVRGGRKRTRRQDTLRDWFAHVITLKKGLVGVKPEKVCHWLFGVLNLQPHDEFHDLFPGSGAVSAAWETWKQLNAPAVHGHSSVYLAARGIPESPA